MPWISMTAPFPHNPIMQRLTATKLCNSIQISRQTQNSIRPVAQPLTSPHRWDSSPDFHTHTKKTQWTPPGHENILPQWNKAKLNWRRGIRSVTRTTCQSNYQPKWRLLKIENSRDGKETFKFTAHRVLQPKRRPMACQIHQHVHGATTLTNTH